MGSSLDGLDLSVEGDGAGFDHREEAVGFDTLGFDEIFSQYRGEFIPFGIVFGNASFVYVVVLFLILHE